jgi:hypothetical protein
MKRPMPNQLKAEKESDVNTQTFTTDRDAIDFIRECLGEYAADHNLRAIFEEAFDYDAARQAFVQAVDVDEFWAIVERNAIEA